MLSACKFARDCDEIGFYKAECVLNYVNDVIVSFKLEKNAEKFPFLENDY